MGIDPSRLILTPLNLGANATPVSYQDAITAATLQSISAAAPSSSLNPLEMNSSQQATFWMLRAATDLAAIVDNLERETPSQTALQNLITDLNTVSNFVDPSFKEKLAPALTTLNAALANNSLRDVNTFNLWVGSSLAPTIFEFLSPSSTHSPYNFSDLTIGEQMSIYNLMLHGLQYRGSSPSVASIQSVVERFWGGADGTGSLFAANFMRTVSIYNYTQNLNANGTLNTEGFRGSMLASFGLINEHFRDAGYNIPFTFSSPDPTIAGLPSFLLPLFNGVSTTVTGSPKTIGAGISAPFGIFFSMLIHHNFSTPALSNYFNSLGVNLTSLSVRNKESLPINNAETSPLTGPSAPPLIYPILDRYTASANNRVWCLLNTAVVQQTAATTATTSVQSMNNAQQNTFWMLRATDDFRRLYDEIKGGGSNQTLINDLRTDLNTISNFVDPSLKSTIETGLSALNNSTFVHAWENGVAFTFYNTMTTPSPLYDFSKLDLSEQMQVYNSMLSALQMPSGSVLQIATKFWSGPLQSGSLTHFQGSAFSAHFMQTASLYYYLKNLDNSGTLNQNNFVGNMEGLFDYMEDIFTKAGFNTDPNRPPFDETTPSPIFPGLGSGLGANTEFFPLFMLPLFEGVSSPAGGEGAGISAVYSSLSLSMNVASFFNSTLHIASLPTLANKSTLPSEDASTFPLDAGTSKPTLLFPQFDGFTQNMNQNVWSNLIRINS